MSSKKRGPRPRRRDILKGLGSSAMVAVGLTGVPGVGAADDGVQYIRAWKHTNEDEIRENGARPKREPVFDTVPRSRYLETRAASNAASRLQRQLDREGLGSVVVGYTTKNGQRMIQVKRIKGRRPVRQSESSKNAESRNESAESDGPEFEGVAQATASVEELENLVPSRIAGSSAVEKIPGGGYLDADAARANRHISSSDIERETEAHSFPVHVTSETRTLFEEYTDTYRPVPGGCKFANKNGVFGDIDGTLGTPAYDADHGEWVLVTAGHLFPNESSGKAAAQPNDALVGNNRIGESDKVEEEYTSSNFVIMDAATIRVDSGIDITTELAGTLGGTYDESVSSSVTWNTIAINEGDPSLDVWKQGFKTGNSVGKIDAVYPTRSTFDIDANGAPGDSGSPIYLDNGSTVEIMGILAQGASSGVGGSAMASGPGTYGIDAGIEYELNLLL